MREGLMVSPPPKLPLRITPAYAGRTLKKLKLRFLFRDHPRVCGNDVEFVKSLYLKPGSPPRVREGLRFAVF